MFKNQTYAWWSNLDHSNQVLAVEAEIDAYIAGWTDGLIRFERVLGVGYSRAQRHRYFPTFSHTFGFYASAVSDFYALHPKAHNADVGDIIGCLADNPIDPCSELARFYESHSP